MRNNSKAKCRCENYSRIDSSANERITLDYVSIWPIMAMARMKVIKSYNYCLDLGRLAVRAILKAMELVVLLGSGVILWHSPGTLGQRQSTFLDPNVTIFTPVFTP